MKKHNKRIATLSHSWYEQRERLGGALPADLAEIKAGMRLGHSCMMDGTCRLDQTTLTSDATLMHVWSDRG